MITQGLDQFGSGDGYDFTAALADGVAFEDMNPEQQGTVAEFIGVAIEANDDGNLNIADFQFVAKLDTLTVEQFDIILSAHDALRQ